MQLLDVRSVRTSLVAYLLYFVASEDFEIQDCAWTCKRPERGASLLQINVGKGSMEKGSIKKPINEESHDPWRGTGSMGQEDLRRRMPDRSLHRTVGKDGVMMISSPRNKQKSDYSKAKLSEVGIYPRMFWATDYLDPNTSQESLEKAWDFTAIPIHANLRTPSQRRWTAAVADSHRRALEQAQGRRETWTAILEDDVVPILANGMTGTGWIASFESAWDQLPPRARLVRLGFCSLFGPRAERFVYANAYDFVITNKLDGLCTTGYIVHKDAIPVLLSSFPMANPVDVSWFSLLPLLSAVNIELKVDVPEMEFKDPQKKNTVHQYGILRQDWDTFPYHYNNDSFFTSLADALIKPAPQSHP